MHSLITCALPSHASRCANAFNAGRLTCYLVLFVWVASPDVTSGQPSLSSPNVLILIADDLGIGDVGCFGNTTIRTPAIDRLCREGVALTHHLAAAALCTPSRAALMTARYPQRYGMVGAASGGPPVLVHVASRAGLPSSEPTIGKAFAAAGYRTHFTGKWHLGSGCGFLGRSCQGPLAHGFNSTFYLPNTLFERANVEGSFWVWPEEDFHYHALVGTSAAVLAVAVLLKRLKFNVAAAVVVTSLLVAAPAAWFLLTHYRFHTPRWYQVSEWMDFNLNFVVMRQTSVLHQRAPLESLSMDMVRATVDFMRAEAASGRSFLAVHAFSHPHTPLVCAPHNRGRSRHGRYGDAVEELDEGVGLLLAALDDMALYNNTIVYFTSDHGGHLEALGADGQRTGGYNGLFKGGKFQGGMEGGIRVPGVLRYPGVVRDGSKLSSPTSLLDVLPTLLELSGLPSVRELLPDAAQPLDGLSLSSLLTGAGGATEDPTRGRLLLHHSGMFVDAIRYNTGEHVYVASNDVHVSRRARVRRK
ncbi:arylsulfatase F isoform X2 [Hyalella azteca]|uniref:Arylsulfatase F isoform X2 n=1 Tax=Hyalella azteca TaxID=294128 RepID=A0A979FHJ2_HYAAZ|nr:arylsulfatase F isoform X2 [Hyalella azteca]